MNQHRSNLVTIMLLVGVALALTVGGVLAQSGPSGVTKPYSSRLTDTAGRPVADGQYDFVFTLYASEKTDQALWSEMQSGVEVRAGNLDVALGRSVPLPPDVADRQELWLAVSVRGPQEADFTLLNPRHNLNAPTGGGGGLTCPHTHFTDYWSGTTASYGLYVNNLGGGDSVRAYSYSTKTDYAGVYAWNLAASGDGTGVYGGSYYGSGVYAYSQHNDGLEVTSDTDWASAIYAHTANGNGVWAVSGNKVGVYATTASTLTNVSAIYGYNSGSPSGGYGGSFVSNNYRGLYARGGSNWYAGVFENPGGSANAGLYVDGTLWVTGAKTGYVTDAAINDGPEPLETGDVVVITGVAQPIAGEIPVIRVRKATTAGNTAVAGVVDQGVVMRQDSPNESAIPSVVGHEARLANKTAIQPGDYLLIVTLGAYKGVKVDASRAPIQAGDLLVSSGSAGCAAASADAKANTVIGKALGELKSGTGLIPVLVTLK